MSTFLSAAFLVGDLMFLNLSVALSYRLSNVETLGAQHVNSLYLFIFSNIAWLFLLVIANPYSVSRNLGIVRVVRGQASFIFVHLLIVAALIFFFKKDYAPAQIGMMYLLFVPAFFLSKVLILYRPRFFQAQGDTAKNIIIVGKGELATEIRRYFLIHPELRYRFMKLFEASSTGLPLEEIQKFCAEKKIAEIYCCPPEVNAADLKRLVEFGINSMISVKLMADYGTFTEKSFELEPYDKFPVFSMATVALDDKSNQLLKRCFDVLFSVCVFIFILSWLFPVIMIAIKLESHGPVFFKQKRTGQGNKNFQCLKFRTMQINPEADSKQAVRNDPRVTRVGAFLRKTSLDELPQFINVLEGTMSVVGPRPHPLILNNTYVTLINRYMARHYVKPGITGLAQASGYRGETQQIGDMKKRIKLDRFYIDNWTFLLDIKIILLTCRSMFSRNEKAY